MLAAYSEIQASERISCLLKRGSLKVWSVKMKECLWLPQPASLDDPYSSELSFHPQMQQSSGSKTKCSELNPKSIEITDFQVLLNHD